MDGVLIVNELGNQQAAETWSPEKTRNETDIIRSRVRKTIEQELADDPYPKSFVAAPGLITSTDLAKALERRPELVAEAAGGRSQETMRAMQNEAAVRADPALRTERFVSDWQRLSAARKQLEQQGDRAGAARASEKLTELAKGLERDPQVETLLRGKARELGIDPKPERSIANELTATLTRERTRAFDMGI